MAKFAYAVVKNLPVKNLPALRKKSLPGPSCRLTVPQRLSFAEVYHGEAAALKVSDVDPKFLSPNFRWAFVGSCLRGTGVAMYNYADYLEKLMHITPPTFCCVASREKSDEDVFRARFGNGSVKVLPRWPRGAVETDELVLWLNVTHIYFHKGGWAEPRGLVLSTTAINLVHCVFYGGFQHGERHARISSLVASEVNYSAPVVPYIVRPPLPGSYDMRDELGISRRPRSSSGDTVAPTPSTSSLCTRRS